MKADKEIRRLKRKLKKTNRRVKRLVKLENDIALILQMLNQRFEMIEQRLTEHD